MKSTKNSIIDYDDQKSAAGQSVTSMPASTSTRRLASEKNGHKTLDDESRQMLDTLRKIRDYKVEPSEQKLIDCLNYSPDKLDSASAIEEDGVTTNADTEDYVQMSYSEFQ